VSTGTGSEVWAFWEQEVVWSAVIMSLLFFMNFFRNEKNVLSKSSIIFTFSSGRLSCPGVSVFLKWM